MGTMMKSMISMTLMSLTLPCVTATAQARCASVTPTVFGIPTWYARHANDDPIFLKFDESSRRLQTLPNQDTTWVDAEECLGKLTRDCRGIGCVRGLRCPAAGRAPLEDCLGCNGEGVIHHMELPAQSPGSIDALKAKHNMLFELKPSHSKKLRKPFASPLMVCPGSGRFAPKPTGQPTQTRLASPRPSSNLRASGMNLTANLTTYPTTERCV